MTERKYVYSDSLSEMVVRAFIYKGERYEWNDTDCLYYSESSDEQWFSDMPEGAEIVA